ncbi:hypothetical protein EDD37DRAFT_459241 [Exophiala viscosa]|uniref:uncharacterized protein n=1 Tax=Exophiala viscosa TaxID=2486360 RepID=UPI0021968771|nr:hypothetical protein EDD37DRAFT_459241 [Exophiala viscosa]
MGEIYYLAEEVIIWLGREEQMQAAMWLIAGFYWYEYETECLTRVDRHEAFLEVLQRDDMFEHMVHHSRMSIYEYDSTNLPEALHWKIAAVKDRLPQAMMDLLSLPYWGRLWIVQEVAMAKVATVSCGAFSIALGKLETLIKYCEIGNVGSVGLTVSAQQSVRVNFQFKEPPSTTRILRFISLRRSGGREPLWELLNEFCEGQCTDPRDKVYSLLGLARRGITKNHIRDRIHIDYEKPVEDIFWDALFECEAPFYWMESIMFQLATSLGMDLSTLFTSLAAYESRSSTAQMLSQCSTVAMHVAKAVRTAIVASDFNTKLRRTFRAMFDSSMTLVSESNVENAIGIGIALGTLSDLPWGMIISEYESAWLCYRHCSTQASSSLTHPARCSPDKHKSQAQTGCQGSTRESVWTCEGWSPFCGKCCDNESGLIYDPTWKDLVALNYEFHVPCTSARLRILSSFVDGTVGLEVATSQWALIRSMKDKPIATEMIDRTHGRMGGIGPPSRSDSNTL